MARTANIIFIVLDVLKPLGHKKILENELEGFGIRMNKAPPNIIFKKKDKGGINLQTMVPQSELDLELIKEVLSEYRQGTFRAKVNLNFNAQDIQRWHHPALRRNCWWSYRRGGGEQVPFEASFY